MPEIRIDRIISRFSRPITDSILIISTIEEIETAKEVKGESNECTSNIKIPSALNRSENTPDCLSNALIFIACEFNFSYFFQIRINIIGNGYSLVKFNSDYRLFVLFS